VTAASPVGASLSHVRRRLGKSSLIVSPLAWGMWRFGGVDVTAARRRVEAALETGIDLFDTADIYGPDNGEPFGAAEALLGRVLAEAPGLRGRMVLATKGGIEMGTPYNSSAGYLAAACEASLTRLGVERIDLYQIHRPDTLAHPAEVAGALERLRQAGKIAEAGVSNHTPAQVAALQAHLPFPLASTQPEFSPLAIAPVSDGVLDQALEKNLGVLAWSPLGGGRLGAANPAEPRAQAVAAVLDRLAERESVGRAAVAYGWIMAHPAAPIPIVGSQQPARIAEAADALKVRLSRADWYDVLIAARGEPLP
jgi:predicted oxidoreductase